MTMAFFPNFFLISITVFLHKQTVDTLTQLGAVDPNGNVDIDTGAVILSGKLVSALYSLVDTPQKFAQLVNDRVRLSFYADFLYPLAQDSTLEDFYKEAPEGDFSPELTAAREAIWNVLHGYPMKLVRFSPAAFLHFGTTRELRKLMTEDMPGYRFLDWSGVVNSNYHGDRYAVYNSYISKHAIVGDGCYIEDSDICEGAVVGEGSVISGVTLRNAQVPAGVVLHGLKLDGEQYICRMYGVNDNPKENTWMGQSLSQPLWTAPLFRVCGTMEEAVQATLAADRSGTLLSLQESFGQADVTAILPWQDKLDDKVIAETVLELIAGAEPVQKLEQMFPQGVSERVERYLLQEADRLDQNKLADFSKKIRIYYYTSKLVDRENLLNLCFHTIRDAVLAGTAGSTDEVQALRIQKDEVVTQLPVRVNWGGGWSDTPPHCLEQGGTVLNAAILLNGQMPIEVTLRKLQEPKFVLASTDIGSYKEFDTLEPLRRCSDPGDAFALHKAALIACGVIPTGEAITLGALCQRLGGGLYMNTRVVDIPKGSGLGTSSILAAACVKGISAFMGLNLSENDLYTKVLCMEQLMSTGGGWQDQVGGLTPGIKLVTAAPGLKQNILSTPLTMSDAAKLALNRRFALIYTGQRRLARNLLREVVGKYIGNDPNSLEVHNKIQQLAVLMRFELERGNIDRFARLLDEHWLLSQRLDAGCTNTCIDQIFLSIDDLIDGRMICGAGGGGFLQVIMKEGVTVQMLENRLHEVFADSGVRTYESRLLF